MFNQVKEAFSQELAKPEVKFETDLCQSRKLGSWLQEF